MATLNGGPGNDTLPGGFDHDTINGLGGNDSLSGVDGNDTLNGGAGNDKMAGGEENDLLLGEAGNDTLDGGLGDDTLKGGVGNDLYLVDSLNDVVEEGIGGGKDTIRATVNYQLEDSQEIESLILDSSGKIGGFGNALGNRITMVGAGQGIMQGWGGNDTLTGGVGNDALNGGDGSDVMAGGKGDDGYVVDSLGDKVTELAGQGFDSVASFLVNYTLGANLERLLVNGFSGTGNALNNTIEANELANKLNGVAGNDLLFGRDGNDTLDGGTGNDVLIGGIGADSVTGGAGNDIYVVIDAGDVVVEKAGGGIDTVEVDLEGYVLGANVENLTLVGVPTISGTGNGLANLLIGNLQGNVLSGEAGNDTLDGGLGDDTLRGGVGNDVYLVDSPSDVVEEGVGGGKDTVRATTSYLLDDSQEIENLVLDSSGKIGGGGNALGNRITMVGAGQAIMLGDGGNDTLTGGVGDDALNGGEGGDIMAGGKGDDGYTVDSLGDKISELAGQGFDSVASFLVNYTLGANLERLLVNGFSGTGNALNNTIEANELGNKLNGAAGDDLILGNDGDDTLDGGTGNDFLVGGAGADRMIGGKGDDFYDSVDDAGDVIVELAGGGIDDTVETSRDGYVLGANIEHLFLVGVVAISGTGNGLANVLSGNTVGNVLAGEAGNDTLDGGGGNDTLKGGIGNDLYLVDNFNDVVEEGAGGGKDTIRTTTTYQLKDGQEIESLILDSNIVIGGTGNSQGNLITMVGTGAASMFGNDGNDTLTGGIGNDELFGGSHNDVLAGGVGNDVITGQDGADTLKGAAGNDVLVGGLGADSLFGEAGADWFSYRIEAAPELATLGSDTITGFQKGVDKIDLRDLITDFGIDADTALAGKFVTLSKSGANTLIQFDQDGSGGAFSAVTLATVKAATLTATDLILESS